MLSEYIFLYHTTNSIASILNHNYDNYSEVQYSNVRLIHSLKVIQ